MYSEKLNTRIEKEKTKVFRREHEINNKSVEPGIVCRSITSRRRGKGIIRLDNFNPILTNFDLGVWYVNVFCTVEICSVYSVEIK